MFVDSLAALRLKDSRQTQAHLSQLAYCPTVGDHQPNAQLFSSHYPASDIMVWLMPISLIKMVQRSIRLWARGLHLSLQLNTFAG